MFDICSQKVQQKWLTNVLIVRICNFYVKSVTVNFFIVQNKNYKLRGNEMGNNLRPLCRKKVGYVKIVLFVHKCNNYYVVITAF